MRVAENQYLHNLHPNPGHESSRATVLNSDPSNTIHGTKLSRLTRITVLVQLLNRPWTKFGEPRLRIHPKRYNPKVFLRHSSIPSTSYSEFFRCGRASIAPTFYSIHTRRIIPSDFHVESFHPLTDIDDSPDCWNVLATIVLQYFLSVTQELWFHNIR